jgi:hypothetical protein
MDKNEHTRMKGVATLELPLVKFNVGMTNTEQNGSYLVETLGFGHFSLIFNWETNFSKKMYLHPQ